MIKAISRLIRLPNLGMVVLTMYLMRWSLLIPILDLMGFKVQMTELNFFLLVLSTVLIAAAGNIINDYHDVSADRLNKPDKVVIDRLVGRRTGITLHFILSSLGVLLGVFLSVYHRLYWLIPVFLLAPVIIWFYSTSFKHRVFLGNLVLSIMIGMVPLLVILFEYPLTQRANLDVLLDFPDMFDPILYWVGMFALFAFLTNLIHEIVKDIEDLHGDREVGSKTIAVVYGAITSRILSISLSIITLSGLAILFFVYLRDWMSLTYFGLFLALPFLLLIFYLIRNRESPGSRRLSQIAKIIMLAGLIYAPLAYLIINIIYP